MQISKLAKQDNCSATISAVFMQALFFLRKSLYAFNARQNHIKHRYTIFFHFWGNWRNFEPQASKDRSEESFEPTVWMCCFTAEYIVLVELRKSESKTLLVVLNVCRKLLICRSLVFTQESRTNRTDKFMVGFFSPFFCVFCDIKNDQSNGSVGTQKPFS